MLDVPEGVAAALDEAAELPFAVAELEDVEEVELEDAAVLVEGLELVVFTLEELELAVLEFAILSGFA